jgi:hypothetical protein
MITSRALLAIFVVFALLPVRGTLADTLTHIDQTAQKSGEPKPDAPLIRVQAPGPSLPPASRLKSDYLKILRPPSTDRKSAPKQDAGSGTAEPTESALPQILRPPSIDQKKSPKRDAAPARVAPVADQQSPFPARKLEKGDLSKLARLAKGMRPGQWMEISPKNCALHKVHCSGPFKLRDVFLKRNLYPPHVWGVVGPKAIVSAWASGAWDGKRLYLSNGGHRDYFGNDVLAYDAERLGFIRLTKPAPIIDFGKKTCRTSSGPPPAHTYDGVLWVPSLREAWFAGKFSTCGVYKHFWAFNPRTLKWRETRVPSIGWGGTALHPKGKILVATGPSSCRPRFRVIDPVKESMVESGSGRATGCQTIAAASQKYFWVVGTYGPPNKIRLTATLMTDKGITLSSQHVSEPVGIWISGTGMTAAPDGGVMLWPGGRNTLSAKVDNGKIVLRHFRNTGGEGPRVSDVKAGVFGRWNYVPGAGVYLGLNHHTSNGVWLYKPPTNDQAAPPPALPIPLSGLLKATPSGQTLRLPKGDYFGATINKPVTIKCDPGARILGRGSKGALQINASPVTIDGCEIRNSRAAQNSSEIWAERGIKQLTIRNSHFINNGNGILIGSHRGAVVTIEDSKFERQGAGGQAHQIYISGTDVELYIRRSLFRQTVGEGHVIKTGAKRTVIEDTRILGSTKSYSRTIDAFAGGVVELTRVVIEHGPNANDDIISFGPEIHRAPRRTKHRLSFRDVKVKCLRPKPCTLVRTWLPMPDKLTGVTVTGGQVKLAPNRKQHRRR